MSESTDRTKGPWTIRRSITGYVDEIVGADGQAICYGGIDEGPAKLIAAAPEMRDELHRLRAENAKLRQQVEDLRAVVIPAGLAQDRMREDAERYRWLRANGDADGCPACWCYYDGIHMKQGAELDAAIDAARGVE